MGQPVVEIYAVQQHDAIVLPSGLVVTDERDLAWLRDHDAREADARTIRELEALVAALRRELASTTRSRSRDFAEEIARRNRQASMTVQPVSVPPPNIRGMTPLSLLIRELPDGLISGQMVYRLCDRGSIVSLQPLGPGSTVFADPSSFWQAMDLVAARKGSRIVEHDGHRILIPA